MDEVEPIILGTSATDACTQVAQNMKDNRSFASDCTLNDFQTRLHSSPEIYCRAPTTVENKIQVLLLDHDKHFLNYTVAVMKLWHYQVTKVRSASTAMRMILGRKKQIDLVIASVDSPDMNCFQFSQEVDKLGILVILTSARKEPNLVEKALENGAFLCVSKPIDQQIIKCLSQFVMRERQRKNQKEVGRDEVADQERFESDREVMRRVITPKRKNRRDAGLPSYDDDDDDDNEHLNKRKICTEWTKELHERFMDAVHQLGEGNCYPKEIAEKMKVPGLTRTQVASHLQKCRHDKWRLPDERKNRLRHRKSGSAVGESSQNRERWRVFGTMPRSALHESESEAQVQQNPPLPQTNSVLSGTDQSTTVNNHGNMESSDQPANGTDSFHENIGIPVPKNGNNGGMEGSASESVYVPQGLYTFGCNSENANHSLPAGQQIVGAELPARSQQATSLKEIDWVWPEFLKAAPSSLPIASRPHSCAATPDLEVGFTDEEIYNMVSQYPYHPPQSGINFYRQG